VGFQPRGRVVGRALASNRVYPATMLCPVCGAPSTRVIDSRPAEAGQAIRRRRECEECAHRFTTYERLEPQLMVRKRNGKLEPFSTAKLAVGMSAALADRPVSGSAIERMAEDVEASLRARGSQVSSEEIGREVLERLRSLYGSLRCTRSFRTPPISRRKSRLSNQPSS